MTNRKFIQTGRVHAGFGLIEIMIALAIGLITTLVITEVITGFEGQKRTTTGTADAQTNGAIGLYMLQRQVQMAGYGLPAYSSQDAFLRTCDPSPTFDHDNDASTAAIGLFPIQINDGGGGASDTILVRRGTSGIGGTPIRLSDVNVTTKIVSMTNNLGCAVNDVVLISDGTNKCSMTRITDVPAVAVSTTQMTLQSTTNAIIGGALSCLGNWTENTYAVVSDSLGENGTSAVAGIVNIQAQYGVSASANDNQVANWVDATGTWDSASMTISDRNRIKAIRVALVARNALLEKTAVSKACSSTTASQPTGVCAWEGTAVDPAPTLTLTNPADGTDWKRYRYRVFETIIPIRNLVWAKGAL